MLEKEALYMWNSNELYGYALQKLRAAEGKIFKGEVKILLSETSSGDSRTVRKVSRMLRIKELTESLREQFPKHIVKSRVESNFKYSLTYEDSPCDFFYRVYWILELQKK